ncbi:MAG TPA: hypothetical protein DC054_01650 [Blastocatellia bacterium]|nr:hypothetical protein [Blastocatellia bacterium]
MRRELTTKRQRRIATAALCLAFLSRVALPGFVNARGPQVSVSRNELLTVRPELVLQTGHSLGVNCLAFGPDGKWLASGGSDNSIKIWQVATGRELRALTGHPAPIKSLATSPDGQWLASGSNDGTVKVWNVSTGRELYSLPVQASSIEALAFSPDNGVIASGDADGTINIWNRTDGKPIKTLSEHSKAVTVLAFSGDGTLLASGSADTTVKVWDTGTWQAVRTLHKHTTKITAIVFSPDSSWLASADSDGTLRLNTSRLDRSRFTVKHDATAVLALAFDSVGSVVSIHKDGGIESWNVATGKEARSIPRDDTDAELNVASFSSDANTLASSVGKGTVNLRKVVTGEIGLTLESHSTRFNAVAFSPDNRWFATTADDHNVRLWQVATGREMPRLVDPREPLSRQESHKSYATTIAFSPDSKSLASGSTSGEVKIWNIATGFPSSLPSSPTGIDVVAFSPDGKFLAVAGMQETLDIWDLESTRAIHLKGHTREITSVVFSRDGRFVYSGGRDKTVLVWDRQTGTPKALDNAGGAEINSLALSPDDSLLASGNSDNTVRIWDLRNDAPPTTLPGHSGEVHKVSFNKDGSLLASSSSDRSVKLWDPKTPGEPPRTLMGATDSVNSVAFSQGEEGRCLVSANADGSMTVWDSKTGTLTATLVSVSNSDDWLVAAPDGLFDGSPASWNLLLWRFAEDTFGAVPVEAYFKEFYYPGLLAEILAGKPPKAAQDITLKDRRQPEISISPISVGKDGKVATQRATIELEVKEVPADREHSQGSGVSDLRLFRNGLLVKIWPGDVLNRQGSDKCESRGTGSLTCKTTIPIVAGENQLSAYAFNRDDIKSLDKSVSITGADNLKRTGTAYVLAIGVTHYENQEFDLDYPVADAVEIDAQLKSRQEQLGTYNPVVTVPLENADATKANILLALRRLAGTDSGPLPPEAPPKLADLQAARPEDAVIIYFSGHGAADTANEERRRFYLIPRDLGYKGSRKGLDAEGYKTIFEHSISDLDLEEALRPLDADQLLLIIDACYSGQALESKETRRGPMNTRGLSQLAYEKGMYILTASQKHEVALEDGALKHSYLASAMIDGIESGAADLDRDGNITLQEWFAYVTDRVPQLRRELLTKRELKLRAQLLGQQPKELVLDEPDEQKVQRPRFFYTRSRGAERLIIAKVVSDRRQ